MSTQLDLFNRRTRLRLVRRTQPGEKVRCRACGRRKPYAPEFFAVGGHRASGALDTICKPCRARREAVARALRKQPKYQSPPVPEGPPCLICGYPTRGTVCINCGMSFGKRAA